MRHIPVDLTVVDPPAGGTTIAVLRLGLDSPHPNSQFFLTPHTTYRATLVDGSDGVCSAASGITMNNNYRWTFSTGEGTTLPGGACMLLDGSCVEIRLEDCIGAGGNYQGDDSVCPPIGLWLVTGDFEVLAGYSREGGELCDLQMISLVHKRRILPMVFCIDQGKKDHLSEPA